MFNEPAKKLILSIEILFYILVFLLYFFISWLYSFYAKDFFLYYCLKDFQVDTRYMCDATTFFIFTMCHSIIYITEIQGCFRWKKNRWKRATAVIFFFLFTFMRNVFYHRLQHKKLSFMFSRPQTVCRSLWKRSVSGNRLIELPKSL